MQSYESARRILSDHMDKLHAVAQVLMEKEKISGDDFRALMEGTYQPEDEQEPEPKTEPAEALEAETAEQMPDVVTPDDGTPAQDTPAQE